MLPVRVMVSPLAYKYIVRLDDNPVDWDQVKALDPNLRVTKGMYMIKYTPKTSGDYKKGRPWKIGQDLIRWDIRVSGPQHWHKLCEKLPELGWLERNSTLTDYMFGLAARHPGMSFIFTVKWEEYEKQLQEKSISVLKTPLQSGFVSRKCSFKEYEEVYKAQDKAMLIRYLSDVLSEVQEVESSQAVQEEMFKATGETCITREQYIKGHGGVHQPKDPLTGRFIKKSDLEKENVEYGDEQDS